MLTIELVAEPSTFDRVTDDQLAWEDRAGQTAAGSGTLSEVELEALTVDVLARPATFATAGEAAWKAAVAAAVGDRDVAPDVRFEIEVEFRLPVPRNRNEAWDLDNLIKPTLDALGGAIGWRRWNGRPQADDERIDRIVASKRTVHDDETVGARILISVRDVTRGTNQ